MDAVLIEAGKPVNVTSNCTVSLAAKDIWPRGVLMTQVPGVRAWVGTGVGVLAVGNGVGVAVAAGVGVEVGVVGEAGVVEGKGETTAVEAPGKPVTAPVASSVFS